MGRVITYYAVGLCENLVPSYGAEIAPSRHRGLLAGSVMTVTGLGNLWGAGLGQGFATETRKLGWLIPVANQYIPALLMVVLVPFTPESPRWLLSKNRREEAERSLRRLRIKDEYESGAIKQEIDLLIQINEEARQRGSGSWGELFKGNYPRRVWVRLRYGHVH